MVHEHGIPASIGYSIPDPEARSSWRDMIAEIKRTIQEAGLAEEIVFHGTSTAVLEWMENDGGLSPTDISEACPEKGSFREGSFWGDILTAAAYAEDTASQRHTGSAPAIIAIRTATLQADCCLFPDAATLDFPIPGLTKLDDPEVMERWTESVCEMSWQQGLEDLGAIIATHQFDIPLHDTVFVRNISDLHGLIEELGKLDLADMACVPSLP